MMKKLYFSRNLPLYGVLILLMPFGGFSLSAQQMFTEHTSGTNDAVTVSQLHFDENSYTKIFDENGDKVFLKNQSHSENTPINENATTEDVSLTINLVFDESQYYVSSVLIFDESDYMYAGDYTVSNPVVVTVPDGTYDVMAEFQPLNEDFSHIVIKEQQSVNGNTTIQLNAADADNYVSITTYDEGGAVLGAASGTGGIIFFDRFIYFNAGNFLTISDTYNQFDSFGTQGPPWNFYISDVSNRYSIIQTLTGAGFEQGNYYNKYETLMGIEESIAIANNPDDWTYHEELFQPTQEAGGDLAKAYLVATTYNGYILNGWRVSTGGLINSGDTPFRGFLNNALDGDPADMLVIPGIIDRYVSTSPTTGGISYLTKGNAVFSDGNGGVLYGSGDVSFNSHSTIMDYVPFLGDAYYVLENNSIKLLPVHPRFSFDNTTTTSVVLGNNVPIVVTGFTTNPNAFTVTNKGRYGESRESDFLATQVDVKQNGSSIFSGTYVDFKYLNLPETGQLEIVLTDANTLVEDLQGKNTTTIAYNADNDDLPPTLQHLQFRNSDDEVTDNFEFSQGATVRLAAGDFEYTSIDEAYGYYTYQEGNNVMLSYSKYNQDDWTELGLTEYPEFSQIPAFGNYYEASLDGVGDETGTGWYDLKVICTDVAGNTQEQVISPAFKINQTTVGIEENTESDFSVYPNPFSNQLYFILPENVSGNYTFKVTDLTGRTVYTNNQSDKSFNWDSSFLTQGAYIISIENNGNAITKKLIKL